MPKRKTRKKQVVWEDLGTIPPGDQHGPEEAIEQAVGLLEPFPWRRRRHTKWSYDHFSEFAPIHNEMHAREVCQELAWDYRMALHAQGRSMRPSAFQARLLDLKAASASLSRKLNSLSATERSFVRCEGNFGLVDSQADLICKSRRPPRSSPDNLDFLPSAGHIDRGRLDAGILARNLDILSKHITSRLQEFSAMHPFFAKPDRGGEISIYALFSPLPVWQLIHRSWSLLSISKHIRPSATADGILHKFIGSIHEYATGEDVSATSRFENQLKDYAKVRRAHDAAADELIGILKNKKGILLSSRRHLFDKRVLTMALAGSKGLPKVLALADRATALRIEVVYGAKIAERLRPFLRTD
ncbi:MAG: hypothetical protein IT541_12635 [Hyphomicrobiales bacterium]|nr:hypothetical protein [Hyphomicrobiales bacterium]